MRKMKNTIKITSILSLTLIFLSFTAYKSMAQKAINPDKVFWKTDKTTVKLSQAMKGASKPEQLTLQLMFEKSKVKNVSKENMTYEFKWFYYYTREKRFMDTYTVKSDDIVQNEDNYIVISSTRKNIMKGWWEVRVVAKNTKQPITFEGNKRFLIYIE